MAKLGRIGIAGGVYVEACLTPPSIALLGSAGRAAMAVSSLASHVTLDTFHPSCDADDVRAAFAALAIDTVVHDSGSPIRFDYLHPLARPRVSPIPLPTANVVPVSGDAVLRFGCLEGSFRVDAKTAVFDPQSGVAPEEFAANGSKAERLALVLNRGELQALARMDDVKHAAEAVTEASGAEVLVVKSGADGAYVCERGADPVRIPAFEASGVYKIGSGDVFSATFAFYWACAGMASPQAAELASLQTAAYVETRLLPCPVEVTARPPLRQVGVGRRRVYLAAPFFNTQQLWLVEEARDALIDLGLRVFSPYHDVGVGAADTVAPADLQGLESSDVVLALLADMDPGTLFECGYARSLGKPVVAFLETHQPQDPTMLLGTGATIETDFATALHRAAWV